jgi:hypothetical protein
MTTKADAALAYASWGWHVLPVLPNAKTPATRHGVNDATTDPEQIRRWWQENPDYNVGIAAGAVSGLIVCDIDPRNGGNDGWRDWLDANGDHDDDGPCQLTAGGGQHWLFAYVDGVRSCKLEQGVDLLSDGRYFLAFPSEINGNTYEWEASSDPFDGVAPATLKTRWLNAMQAQRKSVVPAANGNLIQGNRNSGLTALGGAMRSFGMAEAEILAALTVINETRCEIPLPTSEVSQIARSVARYEPEADVAASVAIGSDAAEAIIAAERAKSADYYLTRATSYLLQPSPLEWVVKSWLPDNGVSMVFGESGGGKTMMMLDVACHIATGKPWRGLRTKAGVVVYLAGEGHYGLRQRVAAWCRHHGVDRIDDLLITNKAIEADAPNAAVTIIRAIREIVPDGERIAYIILDTVAAHMGGDDNLTRDSNKLLGQLNIVASAFSAGVAIIHHVGHSADAKARARGSSNWKAAVDAAILVSKKEDKRIEICSTKMKDAEDPKPLYGRLQSVPLGWVDEDGEEIKGAVLVEEEAPPEGQTEKKEKPESDIQKDIRKFNNAWVWAGADEQDGMPFLSRSDLIDYLVKREGLTLSTAKTYAQESKRGRMIYNLLTSEIISAYQTGWIICDNVTASTLFVRKKI